MNYTIALTPESHARDVEALLQSYAQLRAEQPGAALALAQQLIVEVFPGLPEDPEDRTEELQFKHYLTRHAISVLTGEYCSYIPAFGFSPYDPSEERLALFRANGWSIEKGKGWYEISSRAPESDDDFPQPYADPGAEVPTAEEVYKRLLYGIHDRINACDRTFHHKVQDHIFDLCTNRLPAAPSAKHLFLYAITLRELNTLLSLDKGDLRTVFTTTIPYDSALLAELQEKGWYVIINSADTMEVSTETLTPHGGYDDD